MCEIPSKCTHAIWIFAFAPSYKGEKLTDPQDRRAMKQERADKNCLKSGKWLIFVSRSNIDEVWKKIKKSTEAGDLGTESKVASKMQSDLYDNKMLHVICVYTSDWTDVEDVDRVREKLRSLGIVNKINYKADTDTIAGRHAARGERISKYYK